MKTLLKCVFFCTAEQDQVVVGTDPHSFLLTLPVGWLTVAQLGGPSSSVGHPGLLESWAVCAACAVKTPEHRGLRRDRWRPQGVLSVGDIVRLRVGSRREMTVVAFRGSGSVVEVTYTALDGVSHLLVLAASALVLVRSAAA